MPRAERPLEADGSSLTEFAAGLRKLRVAAGSRTYREMSRRAHYSSTTLSDAAGGKRLPTLAVTVAYVKACDGDAGEWERRWHQVAQELAAAEETGDREGADGGRAPYAGLTAYQVDDADWFHGRERLVDEVVAKVSTHRFVTVIGPSGAGKSSLLRAGLLPRLANSGMLVALFTPGARPIEECAIHIAQFLARTPGSITTELAAERGLHLLTRQAMTAERANAEIVLVIDQFEEVFTMCRDAEERSQFITALVEASRAAASRCRIVLGVRADFYPHCLQNADLATALIDGQVAVGPMTVDELRQVIVRPASLAGCAVEGSLLATLVTHAYGRAGALPLLSHALLETWRRRSGTTLTLTGFERAGGIKGALSKTAEDVYGALDERQQSSARHLFMRLIALGEGTQDTKRRVSNIEFDDDATAILAAFADARLIVLSEYGAEITHEALIETWPRLRFWLVADREGQRIHRQLTEATAIWQDHHQDPGTLLRGYRLAVVADWARRHPDATNQAEAMFVDASTIADEHERAAVRRRTRVLRGLVALLGVLLIVATTTAIQAVRAQQAATQQRNIAVAVNAVRAASNLASTNPKLAAQISLAAYRLHPSPTTETSLIALAAAATAVPVSSYGAYTSVSPDGRLVTEVSERDETAVSTVFGRQVTQVAMVPGGSSPPQFSPDSRTMLTYDRNFTPILWDVTRLRNTTNHTHLDRRATISATSAYSTFSSDGKMLMTTDVPAHLLNSPDSTSDKWDVGATSRIWDISDISRPRQLALLPKSFVSVAVFADIRPIVATVSVGRQFVSKATLKLWDITTPTQPRLFSSSEMATGVAPLAAMFMRDDRILCMADSAGEVTLWNVEVSANLKKMATIAASGDMLTGLAASPDERTLVTTDSAGVLTIWDASSMPNLKVITRTGRNEIRFGRVTFVNDKTFQALAYRGEAGTVASMHRWQINADLSAAVLCEVNGLDMSRRDWEKYLSGVPYRPICA